jgi:hypothetical protein
MFPSHIAQTTIFEHGADGGESYFVFEVSGEYHGG